jgi:hypothetical protein
LFCFSDQSPATEICFVLFFRPISCDRDLFCFVFQTNLLRPRFVLFYFSTYPRPQTSQACYFDLISYGEERFGILTYPRPQTSQACYFDLISYGGERFGILTYPRPQTSQACYFDLISYSGDGLVAFCLPSLS